MTAARWAFGIAACILVLSVLALAQSVKGEPFEMGPSSKTSCGPMFYLHPNQTRTTEMYVENQGGLTDTYLLNLTVDNPRWTGWLDRYELTDVPPGERRTFNVSIKAPKDAVAGEKTNVTLIASSSRSNESDQIKWIEWCIVEKAVTVVCAKPTKPIESGGTVYFNLSVTNIGDLKDQYRIDYTYVPENAGWKIEIDKRNMDLDVDQSANFTVKVSAPEEAKANENGSVFIRVQSFSDPSVWDGKKLTCSVERRWSAILEPGTVDLHIQPGSPTNVQLVLRQRTNDKEPKTWHAEAHFVPGDWKVGLPNVTFEAYSDVDQVVHILVVAPERGMVGQRLEGFVVLRLDDDSGVTLQSNFTMTVIEERLVWLSVPPGIPVYDPTGSDPIAVRVGNSGNTVELLTIEAVSSEGWAVRFEAPVMMGGVLPLFPWSTAEVSIMLSVPLAAGAGIKTVNIRLVSSDGMTWEFPLFVNVRERQSLELHLEGDIPLRVQPGAWSDTVVLRVHNDGNVPFVFRLGVSSGTTFLDAQLEVHLLALIADDEVVVNVTVAARRDATFGPASFLITATSEDISPRFEKEVPVEVVGPDLTVVDVVIGGEPVTGEPLSLSVNVSNVGSFGSGPSELVVVDAGGQVLAGPVTVGPLGSGQSVQVAMSLTPKAGRRTVTAEIGTGGTVREDGEAPNALEFVVDAAVPEDGGSAPAYPPFLPVWIGLVVAIVIIILIRDRAHRPHRGDGR